MLNFPKTIPSSSFTRAALSAGAILMGIQAAIVANWAFSFLPRSSSSVRLFPMDKLVLLQPEHETAVYLVFILTSLVLAFFLNRRTRVSLTDGFGWFLAVETLITFLLLDALFKMTVYGNRPALAHGCLVIFMIAGGLHKIFWRQIRTWLLTVLAPAWDPANRAFLNSLGLITALAFIAAIIYIPDGDRVLARMFMGEQFIHWDMFVMSTGYAVSQGLLPFVDMNSRHGLGMPVLISHAANFWGGFTYLNVFNVLLAIAVLYYLGAFMFLRRWYASQTMALAAILIGIRIQMMPPSAYPLVFTYPSNTPVRFCFDIIFFYAILRHIQKPRDGWLVLAAITTGIALYHLNDTGIYLSLAFFFYLFINAVFLQGRKEIAKLSALAVLGPAIALLLVWITVDNHVWTKTFWNNLGEFITIYLNGYEQSPLTGSLKDKNYLESLMGFLVPLVYLVSLIIPMSFFILKKASKDVLLVTVMSVYGLGLYHNYVLFSRWTGYYIVGLPFIFVSVWWLQKLGTQFKIEKRLAPSVLAFAAFCLVTNHNFISYPNVLSLSRNPIVDPLVAQPLTNGMPYFNHLAYNYGEGFKTATNSLGEKDEHIVTENMFVADEAARDYFRREFDFSEDARLIDELTPPSSRVPVVSSFETKILMDAKRKPFFYYFPLILSRPMYMRYFPTDHMLSTTRLELTIRQIEEARAPFIFMERIFLNTAFPEYYNHFSPCLIPLLAHIREHYEPYKTGHFLVAMKRKTP